MTPGKKKISVFTSAYDEEASIRACCAEVKRVLSTLADRYDYEHVVADNASTDRTLAILKELAAKDRALKVIVNAKNFGAEKSAFNAMRYATGDAVVGVMADLQEPPALIPSMVAKWEEGSEVVYGRYRNPHEGLAMRGARALYYRLMSKLSADPLPRDFAGFALLDRRVVDAIAAIDDHAPFLRGMIATVGFRQAAIDYERAPRKAGRSKHGLPFLFAFGINGIISHSLVPIRAATFTGVALVCLSSLFAVAVVVLKFAAPSFQAPAGTAIALLVAFFAGIQLFFLGMVGEYVGAIHGQVRRRPFVIVRETINFDDSSGGGHRPSAGTGS